jgi:hypothetical protein
MTRLTATSTFIGLSLLGELRPDTPSGEGVFV